MSVAENLRTVLEEISRAAEQAGRDAASVRLVAVSKKHEAAAIEAAMAAGQMDFGENYVQELRDKAMKVAGEPRWHYIGHLQRNKVKYLAPWIHMIHTVDSIRLADGIARRAGLHERRIKILVQVNVAREGVKSGCDPEDASALVQHAAALPELEVCGLMTMPPFWPPEQVRPFFRGLRELRDRLQDDLGLALPELSMGMSADFPAAIEEGATLVRVGTRIFGAR
ncbi:MAG: YggS family pyridoxal phosphate-dependent enzyme [Candidatus Lernaella stagnicola]|nr:YggS family pyridoxal phosphate-dependent enzyme [Candidatus Lernaella stagnicola]